MSTTDLVRYEPKSSIDLAPEAWGLAQKVAATEFVPDSLRNRPEAVLACMLTGHEIGVGPMQALAKIHVIKGRPAMAAELMRAVILAAGHEFWIEEATTTRVTVGGRRKDSPRETRITWTLDDAKRANLLGRDGWRNYPRAMLLARATAELARAMFPDVLAGLSYTVEEISDGDFFDVADLGDETKPPPPDKPTAPVKKVAAKRAATRTREAAPTATSPGVRPPLPGEDEFPNGDAPDDRHETAARPLPGPAAIAVALKDKGVEDREDKLRIVASLLELETLESTKDLDGDQVSAVLSILSNLTAEEVAELAIADAEVVDDDQGEADLPAEPMLPAQYRALKRLCRLKLGIAEDDDQEELRVAQLGGLLGRSIGSSAEISRDDAIRLIDDLQGEPDAEPGQ